MTLEQEIKQIIDEATALDSELAADIESTEGHPGPYEGITGTDLALAMALDTFYMHGSQDSQHGSTDIGLHGARFGRFMLWTNSSGFKSVQVFDDEGEALKIGEQLDEQLPED